MIRILVVEDSPTTRQFLVQVLGSDPSLQVAGTAPDGLAALHEVQRLRPDVVTMDIMMPKLDGIEATRRIMETTPTPIVIVSAQITTEAEASFRALQAGALAVVSRPGAVSSPGYARQARELLQTVKLMAEVKVVRRWPRLAAPAGATGPRSLPQGPLDALPYPGQNCSIIGIGGSTGAPLSLQRLFSALRPQNTPPVLLVQHMTPGFIDGFAQWLTHSTGFPAQVAADGQYAESGRIFVAPDARHMGVNASGRLFLSPEPPEGGLRPAAGFLFRSLAKSFGAKAAGVLLSGMGKDGAEALRLLRDQGALTIAQDAETSVVHGMPGEAIRLGAAQCVLPPERIAAVLARASKPGDIGNRLSG